jgi:hypothetical protein
MTTSKPEHVHLPDELVDWCNRLAEDLVAHYCKGDPLQAMPWTREQMSEQELRRWFASRQEAGRAIDVETCEIGCWFAKDCEPYGILEMLGEFSEDTVVQISRNRFVRSPESNG